MQIRDKVGVPIKIGDIVAIPRDMLEEINLCQIIEEHTIGNPPMIVVKLQFPIPVRPDGNLVTGYKLAVEVEDKPAIAIARA